MEAVADVGVQWHLKRPPARRPVLLATALAFHLVVEVLKQVSHVHEVWPWAPELNDGRVLSPQHASRASQDIAQCVGKEHHVDLRVLELRAKNPLRLTVDAVAREEGPGRSVTSVDRIFRSRHPEHALASA
jgi:hypothetical protein